MSIKQDNGNAAALREALELVLRFLEWMYAQEGESAVISRVRIADEIDRVISALSAPPRNCDVCTAEEQWERFDEFCECWQESGPTGGCSSSCPCLESQYKECDGWVGRSGCFSFWAQTPYEAERKGYGDGSI